MVKIIIEPVQNFSFLKNETAVIYYPEIAINAKEQYSFIENVIKNNDELIIYTYSALIFNCIEVVIMINNLIDKTFIKFNHDKYKNYKDLNISHIYDEFCQTIDHCDNALDNKKE